MNWGKQFIDIEGVKYEICDNGSDFWLENANEKEFTRVLLNGAKELREECEWISSLHSDNDDYDEYIKYIAFVRKGAFIKSRLNQFVKIPA